MKKYITAIFATAMMAMGVSAQSVTWGDETRLDSLSYAVGVNTATSLAKDNIPFDYEMFNKAASNTALGVATLEEDEFAIAPGQDLVILNEYFGSKYQARLMAAKATADTLQLADREAYILGQLFESEHERKLVSKAYGMNFGSWLGKCGMPLEVHWVVRGMQELRGDSAKMTNTEAMSHIRYYMTVTRLEEAKKKSNEWLSAMVQQPGVKALPSGLLYKVEVPGDATIHPTADTDKVTVMYKGSKQNGDVFDESKEPISFQLNQVIKGWTEGVKLIGKGGKITLWIPSNLAYGERGAGAAIGPNEALRFDIELIDVQAQ